MSFESPPSWQSGPEEDQNEDGGTRQSYTGQAIGPERDADTERGYFGWNDIIIADDRLGVAEEVIKKLGFECKSRELSKKQYADPEKQTWTPGRVLLSITDSRERKPVDRETLKQIVVSLRENTRRVSAEVARLAPGEHFG